MDRLDGIAIAAQHRGGEREVVERLRRSSKDDAALSQNRDVVGVCERVTKLVRDENHSAIRRGEIARPTQQRRGIVRREYGSRFVENEDTHVTRERLEDLDALLRTDGEAPTTASGSAASPVRSLSSATRARADRASYFPLPPSATFSATVIAGTREKCCWTIPIPAARASRGVSRRLRVPATRTTPASGADQPIGDAHERRLPGPVLSEQRMDGPSTYDKRCVVQSLHCAKAFDNPLELERNGGVGAHRPVGASMKLHGRSSSPASHSPSARTPNVSVA